MVVCGVSFAAVQFYVSNYMGPELTDILSSLCASACMVLVLKFWKPKTHLPPGRRQAGDRRAARATRPAGRSSAWLPYMLLVVFVLTWGEASIKRAIDRFTNGLLPSSLPRSATVLNGLTVPGLHNLDHARAAGHARRPRPMPAVYTLNWLSAPGPPASWPRSPRRSCSA